MLQLSAVWQPIQRVDERALFLSLYLHHDVLIACLRPTGIQTKSLVRELYEEALQA